MTIQRSMFHDRIVEFEKQLESNNDYLAIKTTNYGSNNYVAYKVTTINGKELKFRVELYGHSTYLKNQDFSRKTDLSICVPNNKVVEGLELLENLILSLDKFSISTKMSVDLDNF